MDQSTSTAFSEIEFSIVVPSGGDASRLQNCLASIASQSLAKSKFEILVGMKIDSELISSVISNAKLNNMQRFTSIRGTANELRNLGASIAKGRWLLFLDDDCLFKHSAALQERLNRHRELNENEILIGAYQSDHQTSFYGKAYNLVANDWLHLGMAFIDTPRFLGGNISYNRMVFADVKFDESMLNGGEEIELAARLAKLGAKFRLEPQWSVVHRSDHTMATFFRRAWQHGSVATESPANRRSKARVTAVASVLLNVRDCRLIIPYVLYLLLLNIRRFTARTVDRTKRSH